MLFILGEPTELLRQFRWLGQYTQNKVANPDGHLKLDDVYYNVII